MANFSDIEFVLLDVAHCREDHHNLVRDINNSAHMFYMAVYDDQLLTTGDSFVEKQLRQAVSAYMELGYTQIMLVSEDDFDPTAGGTPWWLKAQAYKMPRLWPACAQKVREDMNSSRRRYRQHDKQTIYNAVSHWGTELRRSINNSCLDLALCAPESNRRPTIGDMLALDVIKPTLLTMLYAAYLNQPDIARRAEKMLLTMRYGIPFGERVNGLNTWVCLCKAKKK
jgi:hypothetical protein